MKLQHLPSPFPSNTSTIRPYECKWTTTNKQPQLQQPRTEKWAQGRKTSPKTMPPSKIGIPEFTDKIINASSKGAIRPTPHTEWTVKGIYYRKRRPEHKSKICMSIFQQNCRKAYLKSQPYLNIKTPSYFVKNCLKQPMDDDLFD